MIELQHISAGYGNRQVLNDISLTFADGEITTLLGPNGCGKSTLLRTIAGLQPPQGGQILIDNTFLTHLTSRQTAQKITYLPQSRNVPNITAERMVLHGRFPYLSYPRRYRAEDQQIARNALSQMGMESLADSSVQQLSGGQRQKVYLAMALAQDTQNILMDEPTTFLDVRCQMETMALAQRLAAEGRAVVMVLHDLPLALRSSHRLAVLEGGVLRFWGTAEELCAVDILEQVFHVRLGRIQGKSGWLYYYD